MPGYIAIRSGSDILLLLFGRRVVSPTNPFNCDKATLLLNLCYNEQYSTQILNADPAMIRTKGKGKPVSEAAPL